MRASTSSVHSSISSKWNEKWPAGAWEDRWGEGREAGEAARLLEHWTACDGEDAGEQPGVQRWATRPAGERDE
ncbi:hypothetical protein EV363DRAFT_1152310 [Boletus edulis]|nr:hypothetical protein EV363DRAFT_1152310 [Boletus edulis]